MPAMSQPSLLAGIALLCAAASGHAAQTSPAPDAILRSIDNYRMPFRNFEAAVRITPFKEGKAREAGTYLIRSAGYDQVLVEATSFDQAGQKFLTTQGGLFFYAPRTKRAIRLTPLQSLRGQASIGDIARISFENDYTATATEPPAQACPDADCFALELLSKNAGATYSRIVLTVSGRHGQYRPLAAMLYVASGKLLKVAHFDPAAAGLPPATRYADPRNSGEETQVVFEKIAVAQFGPAMFNPRALDR
jgi:hypothetical protein